MNLIDNAKFKEKWTHEILLERMQNAHENSIDYQNYVAKEDVLYL